MLTMNEIIFPTPNTVAGHQQNLLMIDSIETSINKLDANLVLSIFRAANIAITEILCSDNPIGRYYLSEYMTRADLVGSELHRRELHKPKK